MKKTIIAAFLAIASIATSMADQKITYFNLSEKDATTPLISVPFSQKPVLTYSFDKSTLVSYVVVSSDANTEGVKFDLSKDYDITYTDTDTPASINDVVAGKSMSINGNTIILSRLAAGTKVMIFDAAGKSYSTVSANANGIATVDLSSMPSGILVIKAGNTSFKIRK